MALKPKSKKTTSGIPEKRLAAIEKEMADLRDTAQAIIAVMKGLAARIVELEKKDRKRRAK